MRSIKFMSPVDWMRGSLNGRPNLTYDGAEAYSVPVGQEVSADDYKPIMVAKVLHAPFANRKRYYQVRTRSTVNMTEAVRLNLATMGGAGAVFAAVVFDKTSPLYLDCLSACPSGKTLREWMIPILRQGLAAKESTLVIGGDVAINNPWIEGGSGSTVTISQDIINKFMAVLGNIDSPYSAEATAALQAAFTNEQWTTIRDYGFAHPDLVPFINEDPMLVCSLMELGKIRYCIGGSGNYADSGIYGTNNTHVIFKGMIPEHPDEMAVPFGADESYNLKNFAAWLRYGNNKDVLCYGNQYCPGNTNTPTGTLFTLDANKEHWIETLQDGTINYVYTFSTPGGYSTPGTMTIFASRRESYVQRPRGSSRMACASMEVTDGDLHAWFVPFKRDGQMELLDLVSGNLATRVGTFTELIESTT